MSLAKILQAAGYQTAVFGKYGIGAHDMAKEEAVAESILPTCLHDNGAQCAHFTFLEWLFLNRSAEERAVVQDGPGWLGFDYSFVSSQGIQAYGPYCFFENDQVAGNSEQQGVSAPTAKWWDAGIYPLDGGYKTGIELKSANSSKGIQKAPGIFNGVESWKTDQFDNMILEKALAWLTLATATTVSQHRYNCYIHAYASSN